MPTLLNNPKISRLDVASRTAGGVAALGAIVALTAAGWVLIVGGVAATGIAAAGSIVAGSFMEDRAAAQYDRIVEVQGSFR